MMSVVEAYIKVTGDTSMVARIVAHSAALVKFLTAMGLGLSKPQAQHLLNLVSALLIYEGRKSIARLTRCVVDGRSVFSACDFLTYSPWSCATVSQRMRAHLMAWALQQADTNAEILISADDTNAPKYQGSHGFEGADYHYDHSQGRLAFGYVLVTLHVSVGAYAFAAALRLYLREKTIRKLNRQRSRESRLPFLSKLDLVQAMLQEVLPLIPPGRQVYVLFDSWYASKDLIRFCRDQGCQVICALKSNRKFNGKSLKQVRLRNHEYAKTKVRANSANTPTTYLTAALRGQLQGVGDVRVIVSKRNRRDSGREYFLCTQLSLRAHGVLNRYAHRYQIEGDYLYLKDRLGATDFRQRSLAGIEKYLTLCVLALNYLHWRRSQLKEVKTLADVMRLHQAEQATHLVTKVCQLALQHQAIKPALAYLGLTAYA